MATQRRSLSMSQAAAVARLFSPSVFQELARKGHSSLLPRLIVESGAIDLLSPMAPVSQFFETAFSLLKEKSHRHEYIYKAAIAHKLLMGKHTLNTAVMLTEFRVENCKADVALINGTSTVYEIKSERDKLDRLDAQISAYRKFFAVVNVVVGEKHLCAMERILPDDVGVLLLSERYSISTIKEAKCVPQRVSPKTIFESVRTVEAKKILESCGVQVPEVPNTRLRQTMSEKFEKLEPEQVHRAMLVTLKSNRSHKSLADFITALPLSLRPIALSTSLRYQDRTRLLQAIEVPICQAMHWG